MIHALKRHGEVKRAVLPRFLAALLALLIMLVRLVTNSGAGQASQRGGRHPRLHRMFDDPRYLPGL